MLKCRQFVAAVLTLIAAAAALLLALVAFVVLVVAGSGIAAAALLAVGLPMVAAGLLRPSSSLPVIVDRDGDTIDVDADQLPLREPDFSS